MRMYSTFDVNQCPYRITCVTLYVIYSLDIKIQVFFWRGCNSTSVVTSLLCVILCCPFSKMKCARVRKSPLCAFVYVCPCHRMPVCVRFSPSLCGYPINVFIYNNFHEFKYFIHIKFNLLFFSLPFLPSLRAISFLHLLCVYLSRRIIITALRGHLYNHKGDYNLSRAMFNYLKINWYDNWKLTFFELIILKATPFPLYFTTRTRTTLFFFTV